MKKKEKSSMQSMSDSELAKVISEAQAKLVQARVTRYSKPGRNVREGRALRRKIAVAASIQRYKELQHE